MFVQEENLSDGIILRIGSVIKTSLKNHALNCV